MTLRAKKILYLLCFSVLLLPLLQHELHFVHSGKLQGYFVNTADVEFSFKKWWDGSYQESKEKYLNDNTGFREDLVRLNGQINFSLFRITPYGLVPGADNSLYYHNYLYSYFGIDYIGHQAIVEKLRKLRALQDTLEQLGKHLILVHAPSKPFYNGGAAVPLPDQCNTTPSLTNADDFVRTADSLGINQIDVNHWFVKLKSKPHDSLFSKQGMHWTLYGSIVAADSMIRYMEGKTGQAMQHPTWTNVERSTQARGTDDELTKILNLIYPIAEETFTYPELKYTGDTMGRKPNVIFIGDSFTWNLINSGVMPKVCGRLEFWDYFKYMRNFKDPVKPIKEYDWKGALATTDFVVLLYTTITLPELGSGFIEQAYSYYYPGQ